jgi:hypothetical protein
MKNPGMAADEISAALRGCLLVRAEGAFCPQGQYP